MKITRSELRHALYRAKNGVPTEGKEHLYDLVKPLIPTNETWADFSVLWDVFISPTHGIVVIRPEVDYDFIHTTCLEKALHVKNGLTMEPTARQENVLQIVELNMLAGKMTWETYNKTWGVVVDKELKRIFTRLYGTSINHVTEEMILASAPSDGNAMTAVPELDRIIMDTFEEITKEEYENITSLHASAGPEPVVAKKRKK